MWKKCRKIINTLHLWLGLLSGTVLTIVCITGCIYVFHTEITEWVHRDRYTVEVLPSGCLSVDSLVDVVKSKGGIVSAVRIPQEKNRAWIFFLKEPSAKKQKKDKQWLINPYNGQIIGSTETPTGDFFKKILELHRWLLMDKSIGKVIVGSSAIIFVFMLLSGILLWLPRKFKKWQYWKPGFKIMWKAKGKRLNHDLHNTLGFYLFPVMLIIALTGPYFTFDWYKKGFRDMFTSKQKEITITKKNPENASSITSDQVYHKTKQLMPYEGDVLIRLPKDSLADFIVQKYTTGFFAGTSYDKLMIHQYDIHHYTIDKFSEQPMGQQIVSSVKPIHTGELFGLFSKIIYCLSALMATSLPITGMLIWWNKRKKKK